MGEKDGAFGLSLSLSLGCPENLPTRVHPHHHHHQLPSLNLMPFMHQQQQPIGPSFGDACRPSSDFNVEMGLQLRGIDVNRPADSGVGGVGGVGGAEEAVVSSPNSTVSSVSGKRCEREENDAERASDSLEDDGGEAARKKLRLSKEQSAVLEETFKEHNTLTPKQKVALAKRLDLRPRQVEVWFQNRRARTKLKQTEVDCEYLRRCCENLSEENRRLQKEVNELRALKLSPRFYMNMSPPTTLTMCPSCERVAVSSSSSAASSSLAAANKASTACNPNAIPNRAPVGNPRAVSTSPWAAIFQSYDSHNSQH